MLRDVSKSPISVPCPHCGHRVEKTLAWLKFNLNFPCTGCGTTIQVDRANLDAAIRELESAEKTMNDVQGDFLIHYNRRPRR